MKLLLASVLLLAGCTEAVKVSVNCVTTPGETPGVECTVQETAGKSEVDVCWDFQVTCANAAVVKAPRTCQKVSDGGTVKTTIPGDKLTNKEACDGDKPPVASVTNITMNGKPSEL